MNFKLKAKACDITFIVIILVFLAIVILPIFNSFNPVRVVATKSMVPTLNKGDIIFVVPCSIDTVKVGDIIAYHSKLNHGELVAHRVVGKIIKNGKIALITKGDANAKTDQKYGEDYITEKNFFGKILTVDGHVFKIPYLGYIPYDLIRTSSFYRFENKNVQWMFITLFVIAMLTVSFIDFKKDDKKKMAYLYRDDKIKFHMAFLVLFISFLVIFIGLHSTVACAIKVPTNPDEKVFVYNPTEVPIKGTIIMYYERSYKSIPFSLNPEEVKVLNEKYGDTRKAIAYSSFFWTLFPNQLIGYLSYLGFKGVIMLDVLSSVLFAFFVALFFYLVDILMNFYHYKKYRNAFMRGKSIPKKKIVFKGIFIILSIVIGTITGIIMAYSLYALIIIPIIIIILRIHPYSFSASAAAFFTLMSLFLNNLNFNVSSTVFVLVVAIFTVIYSYSLLFWKIISEVVYDEIV